MADDDSQDDLLTETPTQLTDIIKQARIAGEGALPVGNDTVELDSSEPVRTVEYFLFSKQPDISQATFDDYSYDLTRLLEFLQWAEIDDLAELSPATIEDFKDWRKRDGNITLTTLEGQLSNIRVFLRTCEQRGLVEDGLADAIEMPDLDTSDQVSYVRISKEEAEAILDHHQNIDYTALDDDLIDDWVPRAFVEFALMWELLLRRGDCRALDRQDYTEDDDGNKYIDIRHRPDTDTPLKNKANEVEGHGGERQLNVPDWLGDLLDQYLEHHRIDTEDEYGRTPLFTTTNGRVSKSTIQRDIYRITQPCRHGLTCPADRNPDDCEARTQTNKASTCPENVSPHPVRRGGICAQLNAGVPKDRICRRADVSLPVLNKHYDLRAKEEARKERRRVLQQHLDGYGDDKLSEPSAVRTQLASAANHLEEFSPLVANTRTISRQWLQALDCSTHVITNPRLVKGVAAYSVFTMLVGLNLGLLGIGFNPMTMEFIFNL